MLSDDVAGQRLVGVAGDVAERVRRRVGGRDHPLHVPERHLLTRSGSSAWRRARSGASRSRSSSNGPTYWPRVKTSIASRGPPLADRRRLRHRDRR